MIKEHQLRGNWLEFKGKVKEKWGKLTDDDLDIIEGRQDQLIGKLEERYGPDWVEVSAFRPDMMVYYTYELTGFTGNTVGRETEAKLIVPHILKGDWIVSYPRQDCGSWITRVLNERQMRLQPSDLPKPPARQG